MTQSAIPDASELRYHVVKWGSRFRVQDVLYANDPNAHIWPNRDAATEAAERANSRHRKAMRRE